MFTEGYKIVCSKDEKYLLAHLKIPNDAKTNIKRKNLVSMTWAQHRNNKAYITDLIDSEGNSHMEGYSCFSQYSILTYRKHTTVYSDYDENTQSQYGNGIYFFINKDRAQWYKLEKIANGPFKDFYDNGQLHSEYDQNLLDYLV